MRNKWIILNALALNIRLTWSIPWSELHCYALLTTIWLIWLQTLQASHVETLPIAPRCLAISSRAPLVIHLLINFLVLCIVSGPYLFLTKKTYFYILPKDKSFTVLVRIVCLSLSLHHVTKPLSITYFVFPHHSHPRPSNLTIYSFSLYHLILC